MSSRRIRVLEMIDEASLGGGQMHVLLLAKHLNKNDFDVTIATEPSGFLVEKAKEIGISTLPITISNSLRWKTLLAIRRLLHQNNFDILHTHGGTAGFWGRVAAVLNGSPRVRIHTYHGLHYLSEAHDAPKTFHLADRIALPFTIKVVCVCQSDLRKGLAANVVTEGKGVVIHNGIETDRFGGNGKRHKLRSALGAKENDIVVGNIGRLHNQKGQSVLLNAFRIVAEHHPDAHLWLIGEGELRDELQRLARELDIEDQVSFLGARTDIPELLSAMDIFVLSSLWEGQPIALLEAMVSGKPVVATNVDGIPEIIENGKSGLLVEPMNGNELASAIRRLIDDPQMMRTLALSGLERITEEFTAHRMAERIAELYRGCLK